MNKNNIILIDNGSYQCRAGFAGDEEENPKLIFKNVIAKLRKERGKRDVEIQVGNEIENLDAVRFALKNQFDRNCIVNLDVQETIFDYLFSSLNVSSEDKVDHPLLISEAFLNPNYCRHLMSELLFECYQVPLLSYGVDCLFSFKKNHPDVKNALIVSLSNHTLHIIPFVGGSVDFPNCRRINFGGSEITGYLHRLLQLKYPAHTNTITLGKVEEILHTQGYIAEDYFEELDKWTIVDFYNQNVLRLQLPTKPQPTFTQTEMLKEKRKEIARKMVEMNARRREEKLQEDEERLQILTEIRDMTKETSDTAEIQRALKAAGLSTTGELIKTIAALKTRIYKVKHKIKDAAAKEAAAASGQIPVISTPEPAGPKTKLLKIDLEDKDFQDKEKFDAWILDKRNKRADLLKKRSQRRQKRTDMVKRRTAAAQERMRILSQLASSRKEKNDTFGMKDEDWEVYKSIQKDGGSSSEEDEEELNELEQVLKAYDPIFKTELEIEAKSREDEHELHISLEKTRAPELIFQPSMMGEPQAGLAEAIEHILTLYPANIQSELVQNIFFTGGLVSFPGLIKRMDKYLLEMRPFQSTYNIKVANDPVLDAWKGMKSWVLEEEDPLKHFISRNDYEEFGGEYLKEHSWSNKYFPSPSPQHSEIVE